MNYKGKIIFIGDIETVGQNAIQKRTFVLEELSDKEFKGGIAIDLVKDKVTSIDRFNIGDIVECSLNFRTNYSENTQKYYTSITTWKIEGLGSSTHSSDEDERI